MSLRSRLWIEGATAFITGWLLGMGLAGLAGALPVVGITLMVLIGLVAVGAMADIWFIADIGTALLSALIRPIGWLGHRIAGTSRADGASWQAHLSLTLGFGGAIALWLWFWPPLSGGKA